MSYTNVDMLRPYLAEGTPVRDSVLDEPLTLSGGDYRAFYRGAVESGSVVVKAIQGRQATRTTVSLVGGSAVISDRPVVPGSVVAAGDSSLGTLFEENLDYVVDHARGVLAAKSGGSLAQDASLTVWYQPYTVYAAEEDYRLAADRGEIKRLAGGGIADGERVLVDYRPVAVGYSEQLLAMAVTQANGLIEASVDPNGRFGADPGLQVAATYRALELISQALAARELSGGGGDRAALAWLSLAQAYGARADGFLAGFRPPVSGPSNPKHS